MGLNHYGPGGWRPGTSPVRRRFYRDMQPASPTSLEPTRDFDLLAGIRSLRDPKEKQLALEQAIEFTRENDGIPSGILVAARREFYF